MTQRVDAALAEAEQLRTKALAELEAQRAATEAYQQALQRALDERFAEVAAHHTSRLGEFDQRLATLAAQPVGVAPEDLLQIRQSMREDIWRSLAPVTERLDALADANRRTDEQAIALVQHVNTSTASLAARIDDGDQRVGAELNSRLAEARDAIIARVQGVESAATDLAEAADSRIAQLESTTEAGLADVRSTTDARITELQTTTDSRFTDLHATTSARDAAIAAEVGAVGDLVSDALATASARLEELEGRLSSANLELATLATKVDGIDETAIEDLKSQMSAAIGESMLVRIELDRFHATIDDKIDKTTVRLGEIEALLTDEMDVGAAVQLERLDELERAVMLLDPDQFVKKDGYSPGSSETGVNPNRNGADSSSEQALNGSNGHQELGDEFTGGGMYDSSQADTHSWAALRSSEAWS